MNDIYFYKKALGCITDLSTGDATAKMAKENAFLGLASIHAAYNHEGASNSNIRLIALPDFTMTRNKSRWDAGFSYGCVVLMDSELPPLIPVGFRPNCCGVTMLKLKEDVPCIAEASNRLVEIIKSMPMTDDDDFSRGNHFLAILKRHNSNDIYALLHSSFGIVKRDSENGPGLYPEKSRHWKSRIKCIDSIGYPFEYLYAKDAIDYYKTYMKYDEFTKTMRAKAMLELFDGAEIIFNETHEGFYGIDKILLGAYVSDIIFEMPIMIAPDQPVSWVKINKTIDHIAEDSSLPPLYMSPHGAGYTLNDVINAKSLTKNNSVYEIKYSNKAIMHCSTVQDLMISYRKNVTEFWSNRFGGCQKSFDLTPLFFSKV
ncbi:hypothetical protein [Maridesulfovibrio salexigens]|uniref:Uncharacterized protein n=1 Tax=Maridesulfovibrio salexigens (strain ATCC 14822 / DSM 2638 / NCIMB 8403 / VKM B-1763) TaxID=526222 RepID=C6BT30_MARSD|nr:hypothetical protein [Maridesulfovibrio salexigens]ACS79734.1 hypothetical protein Desal_1672 [Maridesulfovibrio salexigens DSM 2638]